jgi:hypothetical protein
MYIAVDLVHVWHFAVDGMMDACEPYTVATLGGAVYLLLGFLWLLEGVCQQGVTAAAELVQVLLSCKRCVDQN